MRRHLALLGIGIAVTVALVVFLAPGARAVGAAVLAPAVSAGDPLPLEKQYRFVANAAGTLNGHSGYTIAVTGDGTFGKGLTGDGVWSIFHPFPTVTVDHGTWKALQFVHYQAWGGSNERAFGGQLTIKIWIQVDDGPAFPGTLVVTCLLGHPPAGMVEGIMASGGGANFNTPVGGVTLFATPSFQVDNDLVGSSAHLIAMVNRQSIGACNLGCC